jgi:hypothetical protein
VICGCKAGKEQFSKLFNTCAADGHFMGFWLAFMGATRGAIWANAGIRTKNANIPLLRLCGGKIGQEK